MDNSIPPNQFRGFGKPVNDIIIEVFLFRNTSNFKNFYEITGAIISYKPYPSKNGALLEKETE